MKDEKSDAGGSGLALFGKARSAYIAAHEQASHDLMQRVLKAQHDHRMASLGAGVDWDRYVEAVRAAWRAWQDDSKGAYDMLVGALGVAWTRTARDQLDPVGLTAIANGLVMVAQQSASVGGNLDVFVWTGVAPPDECFAVATSEPASAAAKSA